MQNQRDSALRDARMGFKTEELLNTDGKHRPFLSLVIDGVPVAGGGREEGGRFRLNPLLHLPVHEGVKRAAERFVIEIGKSRLSNEEGRKPVFCIFLERLVREIRPVFVCPAQKQNSVSPLTGRL